MMKEIVLKPKNQPKVGLEAEVISPEIFAGKSTSEIGELPIYEGKIEGKLADFFHIKGESGKSSEETRIIIEGDVSRTKRIGQEMRGGEIIVKANVGMHLGSKMRGGRIVVEGDADAFAAQEIRGGEVHIKGNAGNYLGSAYRGNWRGIRGGTIIVDGNAGSEIGTFMRGGVITVKGNAGPFAGVHMNKGLIIINGTADKRVGAEMIGGTIVVNQVETILPGFKLEGREENPKLNGKSFKGKYIKYSGDHADARAKGAIYVKK
jgi:formylmethanofuran dehydrogenase subunit C